MCDTTITSSTTGLADLKNVPITESGSIIRSLIWTKDEIYTKCEQFKLQSMFTDLNSDATQDLPSLYYTTGNKKCNFNLTQMKTLLNSKYPDDFNAYERIVYKLVENKHKTTGVLLSSESDTETTTSDNNPASTTSTTGSTTTTTTYSSGPIRIKLSNTNKDKVNTLISILFELLANTRNALIENSQNHDKDIYITKLDSTKRNYIPYIQEYMEKVQKLKIVVDSSLNIYVRL